MFQSAPRSHEQGDLSNVSQMLDFASIGCISVVVPAITIRLPKELIEWLRDRKKQDGVSIQKNVELALNQFRNGKVKDDPTH